MSPAAGPNPKRGALLAMLGGVLFGLSAPGTFLPMGEWLVLPGLAIWFAIAQQEHRANLHSYLFGCAYMAWFSWSVHHVLLPAYLSIVFAGGLYFLLGTVAVRAAPVRLRPLAFAVAVAGTFWLRAVMPDIHYPHGQPAHALWQWPSLLVVVAIGGEPLMNFLLGWLAAAGLLLWRSWRVATVRWGVALAQVVAALLVTVAAVVGGHVVHVYAAPPNETGEDRTVDIAAIEPGYHPTQIWYAPQPRATYNELLEERLITPTRGLLEGEQQFDLILWPESSILDAVSADDIDAGRAALLTTALPKSDTRLVVGATLRRGEHESPGALLVELQKGLVLQHHDKQRLVPGGEFLPFVGILPEDLADSIRLTFQEALGTPAHCRPGSHRPPMQTASGVPFGALLCYDNAFPEPAARHVADGAEFLVVLSNEAWYQGGAELTQLVAMTVVRALENAVPIVRCTLDGHTVAIGPDGQVLAGLEIAPAPQPNARILQVSIDRATGRIPPLAWLRGACGGVFGLLTALLAAHGLLRWVRLRAANTALPAAAGSGRSGTVSGGS